MNRRGWNYYSSGADDEITMVSIGYCYPRQSKTRYGGDTDVISERTTMPIIGYGSDPAFCEMSRMSTSPPRSGTSQLACRCISLLPH